MRQVKMTILVLVAIMAMGAMAAGTASAAKKKLDLTWNGLENQLKAGEEFKMANNTGVTLETSVGNITCPSEYFPNEQGFNGVDETNNEVTDKVEINSAYGAIGASRYCSTATPLGSEALVYFYYIPPKTTLSLSSNGKAGLAVANKAEPAYVYIAYTGGTYCYYTYTSLKASVALVPWSETGWNQVEVTFNKAKLKLDKPYSLKTCPKTTALDATFQWQLTNPEIGYFIFGHLD